MEKKTIGKFISALRRANGMTQKELGEKLFVSDKTVSRWECDECVPELSLIPVIAEIFGVTTDELLRGERNSPEKGANTENEGTVYTAKAEKQFKRMLDSRLRKYKNVTLISIGISIVGLISAMIANLGFYKGLIGFCLASAFIVASEICQICFTVNARLFVDEDDEAYADRLREANERLVQAAVRVSVFNIGLWAFCMPIVGAGYYGLDMEFWFPYGLLATAISLALTYVIYGLFVRKYLVKKELISLNEEKTARAERDMARLGRLSAIAGSVALAIGIVIFVINSIGVAGFQKLETFDDPYEFKEYVQRQYSEWYQEGYDPYNPSGGDLIVIDPELDSEYTYPAISWGEIKDSEGNVICKYYYNEYLYVHIEFSGDLQMPVTVLTKEVYYDAVDTFNTVQSLLYGAIVVDLVVCASVYVILLLRDRRK